jgi:hypothetical protein
MSRLRWALLLVVSPLPLLLAHAPLARADEGAIARGVACIGLTVSDADRSPAEQQLGFSRALLARDPDGHAVQLAVAATHDARSTR